MEKYKRISVTEAKKNFFQFSNSIGDKKNRVIVTRNGKDFFACIPMEDLKFLEQMENK